MLDFPDLKSVLLFYMVLAIVGAISVIVGAVALIHWLIQHVSFH